MMNKYGLRHIESDQILIYSLYTYDYEGGDVTSCDLSLEVHGDDPKLMWLVDDPQLAEWVRLNSTDFYLNAQYETPKHSFKAEELEVVEVKIVAEKVDVKLPTVQEFYTEKFKKTGAKSEREHMKKLLEEGKVTHYGWYDLKSFLLENPDNYLNTRQKEYNKE